MTLHVCIRDPARVHSSATVQGSAGAPLLPPPRAALLHEQRHLLVQKRNELNKGSKLVMVEAGCSARARQFVELNLSSW